MAAFDPRRVLRAATNELWREYFTGDRTLAVPWADLRDGDGEPLFDAIGKLNNDQRLQVLSDLRDIGELDCDRGTQVVAELVAAIAPDRMVELKPIEGRADRALWLRLMFPDQFDIAAKLNRADSWAATRFWTRRAGWPHVELHVTKELNDRLAQALTEHYRRTEARGDYCHIDHYRRASGAEFFFVTMSDYPDRKQVFRGGVLSPQSDLNTFDHVFVYHRANRTVEMYARGGKKVQEPAQLVFGRVVLGADRLPDLVLTSPYQLNGLLDPYMNFPTEPSDRVLEVRVRRLRVVPHARPKRRVTLEADPEAAANDIHEMVREYLAHNHLSRERVNVTLAAISVTHVARGDRQRTFSFDISYPHTCSLKSLDDEQRVIGERCLKLWGIDGV